MLLPLTHSLGRLRACIKAKLPKQNFTLHDSKFVAVFLTQIFPFEQMTEHNAGLLRICLREGLIE
jgi:hypothetical protein